LEKAWSNSTQKNTIAMKFIGLHRLGKEQQIKQQIKKGEPCLRHLQNMAVAASFPT